MDESQAELMKCLKRLYDGGDYSDLVIKCNGTTYNVHKALVCTQSEFFAGACRWPGGETMKREPESCEGHTSGSATEQDIDDKVQVVDLDDDDPVAVWAMVRYLYQANYPAPTEEVVRKILEEGSKVDVPDSEDHKAFEPLNPDDRDPKKSWACLYRHSQIYTIAEKYGIPGLKSFAGRSFNESLDREFHGTWPDFARCVREVYTATPEQDRQLRDALKTAIVINMKLVEAEQAQDILAKTPQLAVDVLLDYYNKQKTT